MTSGQYTRMALYYLLYYTTVAVFVPYFNLYLAARGFSNGQVGVVLAVMPLVALITRPIWGMVSDVLGRQRPIIAVALVMAPIILAWFPAFHSYMFAILIAAGFAIFQTAVIPIADAMTMQNSGARHYGKVRMFGSLGYALMVAVASPIYHRYGISFIIPMYAIASLLALVGLWMYPVPRVEPFGSTTERTHVERSMFSGLRRLLRNRSFMLVVPFTFLASISQSMNGSFFSLYYKQMHYPIGLLGLIYGLGALCELPVFFVSGRLIERFGCERILFVGYAVFALRWLVLAFNPPLWLVLVQQLTHGVSLGLAFAAGIVFAARVSDKFNRATAQTVYSTVNTGVAAIVGSLIGGIALQKLGTHGFYECAFVLGTLGSLGILWTALVHRPSGRQRLDSAE